MPDAKDVNKTKLVFDTLKLFFKTAWKMKPSLFVLKLIAIIQGTVSPFVNVIFPKLVIDELMGERNVNRIIILTALTVGLNFFFLILNLIINNITAKYKDYIDRKFSEIKVAKCMRMDFQHTEDPDVLDQISKAEEGLNWYSGGAVGILECVTQIIMSVFKLIGAATLFIIGYPFLIVILIVAIAIISVLNSKINSVNIQSFKKLSKVNRGFGYTLFQLSEIQYGKDIRLYGAVDMMLEKGYAFTRESTAKWQEQAEGSFKYQKLVIIINAIRDGLVYFLLGFAAVTKEITIGDFTMFTGLTYTFNSSLEGIIFNVQDIYKRCCYGYEFVKFMNYPDAVQKGTKRLAEKQGYDIEFVNVSFHYPRTDADVLKNVSIKIKSGEHLAVVGLNGAGKTTFIKLLCRLYDVTEGEILLDGINIKEYDYEEYIRAISIVFQDFKLFAFTAAENITLKAETDKAEIKPVIELAGLSEAVEKLENGVDTYMFKSFEEKGVELSGGQQQKLAIARALYKNSPIVILDEPTAALDPMAEYEIYNKFNSLIGGKTAIYISHRLSSCKFCDKIAVFSNNTIKEYGTHNELMNLKNGVYAEMFGAQSTYYVTA